jgi:uncharacterized repeat protein (TIGR01451 family)
MTGVRVLAASIAFFAIALLSPSVADAQVIVKHVRVTVSPAPGAMPAGVTATYCDTGTPCAGGIQVWNLGTGIVLAPGDTLVLTQTGSVPVGGNFDTSDRVLSTSGDIAACQNPYSGCAVSIDLDTGLGLSNVYMSSAGDPISNYNGDSGSGSHQEQAQWTSPVAFAPNYILQLGYADNVHGCTAPAAGTTTCFPNPFDGSAGTNAATVFLGHGITISAGNCVTNCYDGGALLITGIKQDLSLTSACMAQTTGQVNVPYSSFIETSGGMQPYTVTLSSGSLPPGLVLNPLTGEIQGVPTKAGTFEFNFQVIDSSSPMQMTTTNSCSITVVPPNLFILKEGPSEVSLGAVFDFTILVQNNGNSPQFQVSIVDQLPKDGMFVSSQPSGFSSRGNLIIPLGDLSPGSSMTATVTWQAPQKEVTLVNSASVFSTSSSAGPSVAEVGVSENTVSGKLDDLQVFAAGTGLRNRTGNVVNGMKVDGIIRVPQLASFVKVEKAFLVWAILFQGNVQKVSNKITLEGTVLEGINATGAKNKDNNRKNNQSGPLCWKDRNLQFDDATVGFVADVTAIVQKKPPSAAAETLYIVTDPVNGKNLIGPDGNDPTPAYPVTDGASLVIFYKIEGQPKTQVFFDFQYDSNAVWKVKGKVTIPQDVVRKFVGISVNAADPEIILIGADGQNDLSDKTEFTGNPQLALPMVTHATKPNLWNGTDPLQQGTFKIGNLWDTVRMTLPTQTVPPAAIGKPLLKRNAKNPQTLAVTLLGATQNPVTDCVGISGAVLYTPQ